VTRCIDLLQFVTTNIYNTIVISIFYKSLHARSSPACSVFTRHFLVTASNKEDFPTSLGQVLSSETPVQNEALNLSLAYNTSTRTTQKTRLFYCCVRLSIATGMCLPSRFPETALLYPPTSLLLHSNGSTRYNIFNFYATILEISQVT
jgi:hypothetical protein